MGPEELRCPANCAPGAGASWSAATTALARRGAEPAGDRDAPAGPADKAREAYEAAIAADAAYAPASLNLGVLHDLYLGHPAQALELYNRYLALTPAGDAVVAKWVADVKRRAPAPPPAAAAASAPADTATVATPKDKP
jgi:tetratricopeptide (TPR) repeat protein